MINRKIDMLPLSWDNSDKWGSVMSWAFACADALYFAGEMIPSEWQFQPGAMSGELDRSENTEHSEAVWITEDVEDGTITWDDVRHLGNALMRYRHILDARGESY